MSQTDEPASDEEMAEGVEPDGLTQEEADDLIAPEALAQEVTYSGQDFDINGLVRRLKADDILIPSFGHDDSRIDSAGFQRSFVWSKPQMDRFIESVLLGYPIPGIFLIRQTDKRYLVLDGQQRLTTLRYFEEGIYDGKEFSLKNVAEKFQGLTYKKLPDELRRVFDDTFLQATVMSTDGTTESLEAIYRIFERLNSGGTQLTPHEIRVALFAGPLIDFVEDLNRGDSWRELYGKRSKRLRDQELVLRIVALYVAAPTYKRPLKGFLNGFVSTYRDISNLQDDQIAERFRVASELILGGPGADALRSRGKQVNAALTEAVFVGLMRRLDHGSSLPDADAVSGVVADVQADSDLLASVSRSTADEEQVRRRLEITTAMFSKA